MKLIYLLLLPLLLLTSCSRRAVLTSSNAQPAEVSFLEIPPDASDIRFWDDGHNQIAVFKISESQFRSMFSNVTFTVISEPKSYLATGFGDSSKSLYQEPQPGVSTSDGLFYQKIETNGGGATILFDRSAGIGFYDYARW